MTVPKPEPGYADVCSDCQHACSNECRCWCHGHQEDFRGIEDDFIECGECGRACHHYEIWQDRCEECRLPDMGSL